MNRSRLWFCAPCLRKTAVGGDEAFEHRHDQLGGLDRSAAIGQQAAVVGEITMERCGQLQSDLDGFVVGDGAELRVSLIHGHLFQ